MATQADPYAAFSRPVDDASDPYATFSKPAGATPRPAARPAPTPMAPAGPVASAEPPRDPNDLRGMALPGGPADTPLMQSAMTPAQALEAYKAAHPEDANATVVPFGADNYPGSNSQLDPASNTYVQLTESQRLAKERAAARSAMLEQNGAGYSAAQEATGPLNDELAFAAGGLTQGGTNLLRQLSGQPIEVGMLDAARADRTQAMADREAFQKEHPYQAATGGVLGGFAFTPSRGAALPGLLGRLGQSGAIGSGYGVAEGDTMLDRAGKGAWGAAFGVGSAGLLEAAPAAVNAVSGGVMRARAPTGSLGTRAENRIGRAIDGAITRDGGTADNYLLNLPNRAEGKLPFETGGENLLGLAETVANAPGPSRPMLMSEVKARADEANNRISTRLADELGAEGNGFQAIRDRIKARSDTAKEGMAPIENTLVPLDDASVLAFRNGLTTPAVKAAAQEALADLSDTSSAAANRLLGLGEQVLDNPGAAQITVREAQDISYALKEAASRAYKGGFNSRGEALQNLSSAIRQNARDTVPEYNSWLTRFGDDSGAIDAMRSGRNVFAKATEKNAASAAELRTRWGKWSDNDKDSFRLGVGEAVLDKVGEQGGIAAMRRLLKSDEFAERVKIAFKDEEGFLKFMRSAQDEVDMKGVESQVLYGSPTARRQAGRADLEQEGIGASDVIDFATDITSPVGMTRQAIKQLGKRLPRQDRSILGNNELNGLLGRGLVDEAEMNRLLTMLRSGQSIRDRASAIARPTGLLGIAGSRGQNEARSILTP